MKKLLLFLLLLPGAVLAQGPSYSSDTSRVNTATGKPKPAYVGGRFFGVPKTGPIAEFVPGYTRAKIRALTTAPLRVLLIDAGISGYFSLAVGDNTTTDDGVRTLVTTTGARYKREVSGPESIDTYGATPNGGSDDGAAILAGYKSERTIVFLPGRTYTISALTQISGVSKLKIIATGATILQTDNTKASFLFQGCNDIEIEGGDWGCQTTPTANGGNSQHIFQFEQCKRVVVSRVHILNSPEMGIAITNSYDVTIQNSLIEHCFRDGTYSHYSAKIRYLNNRYRQIKDDAMSFHDYGRDTERSFIAALGYTQATDCLMENNDVEDAYQGVGAIAPNTLTIRGNIFKRTVLAAVGVFNSKELYGDGTALAQNVTVTGNESYSACSTVVINSVSYTNNGQAGTGRAAIFVGSLGTNNQLNAGESKRLTKIIITNNKTVASGALGVFFNLIDGLTMSGNLIQDGAGAGSTLSGDQVEGSNTTLATLTGNKVTDTRTTTLHRHAYTLNNVTGTMSNWDVNTTTAGESLLVNATPLAGMNSIASPVAGDLLYFNGTSWIRIPIGTSGQFLKVVSGIPAWAN